MASGCQLKIGKGSEFKVKRFRVIRFWLADFGYMESLCSVFLTIHRSKYYVTEIVCLCQQVISSLR